MSAQRQYFVSVGQRFGRGVVIAPEIRMPRPNDPARADRGARLRCDCGTIYTAHLLHLRNGKIQSCGCLHRETAAQLASRRPRRPGRR